MYRLFSVVGSSVASLYMLFSVVGSSVAAESNAVIDWFRKKAFEIQKEILLWFWTFISFYIPILFWLHWSIQLTFDCCFRCNCCWIVFTATFNYIKRTNQKQKDRAHNERAFIICAHNLKAWNWNTSHHRQLVGNWRDSGYRKSLYTLKENGISICDNYFSSYQHETWTKSLRIIKCTLSTWNEIRW